MEQILSMMEDLSIEISGLSAIVNALGTQFDEKLRARISDEEFAKALDFVSNALFRIESQMDGITSELCKMRKTWADMEES